jgi:polyferredoxin
MSIRFFRFLVLLVVLCLGATQIAAAQTADDPWGFEEEEVETWGDILAPQVVDIVAVTAFITLALVGFFRKSDRIKVVTFVAAIAYMGFTKSYLLSVTDIFRLVDLSVPVFKYNIAWYIFAVFSVVTTVLFGRLYCGRVCAYGALTQMLDRVVPARFRVDVPRVVEDRAAWIKYGLLGTVLLYFLATHDMMIYKYVEPFWMFGILGGTASMWIGLGVLLVATVFVRNLYCRFLCPVGAMLGIMSNLTVFRIKRWSECKTCKICEKTCQWGAIRGPVIVKTECVRCDDCERLYLDQQKCPHWIILRRKSKAAVFTST